MTLDQLIHVVGFALGPIRFEGNRRPVVAVVVCAIIRGVDPEKAVRYGRMLGRHTLTQERINFALRLPRDPIAGDGDGGPGGLAPLDP